MDHPLGSADSMRMGDVQWSAQWAVADIAQGTDVRVSRACHRFCRCARSHNGQRFIAAPSWALPRSSIPSTINQESTRHEGVQRCSVADAFSRGPVQPCIGMHVSAPRRKRGRSCTYRRHRGSAAGASASRPHAHGVRAWGGCSASNRFCVRQGAVPVTPPTACSLRSHVQYIRPADEAAVLAKNRTHRRPFHQSRADPC